MPAPAPTIAAIATPPGRGGIGIVRVSGTGIEALIAGILGSVPAPRAVALGDFLAADGGVIDSGLALYFPAPRSYTGESVLELHGHGSPAALRMLLSRCLELGARIAEPGEFTKRAFLNGKLDLAQAEAVADLIAASTQTAARAAVRSLTGEFSREVGKIVDGMVMLRMFVEATLDFPEDDVEFVRAGRIGSQLAGLRDALAGLGVRARAGARLREGLTVVLVGRPNVGKSSLLNRLVREDAAIVTSVPGTTRDPVERAYELAGVPLHVIDTAGLRDTSDPVESVGIERTWSAIERADLVLLLVDARAAGAPIDATDAALLARMPCEVARIVVHNKIDLVGVAPHVDEKAGTNVSEAHVYASALTGAGLDLLEREMSRATGTAPTTEDTFLARERHVEALRLASAHVDRAVAELESAAPALELCAEELRQAQMALASITGEFTADDLLGVIFSRFCIGK